jgi:hypothetical protein
VSISGVAVHTEKYRVSVEVLENGFKVEVPDMEAIAKKHAEDKKKQAKDGCAPSCYYGDMTKSYAAKTIKEVLKLVQASLEQMPEGEYDAAFNEASNKK